MPKNIVICCDGTGNHIVSFPTNVLHTYTASQKTPNEQVCYYNTGLGTTALMPDGASDWSKLLSIGKGLAFGRGLKRDVRTAYQFLVDNYQEGDKVFMFGFSRGAYTLRVLAGFLFMYGLMDQNSNHLFNYAFDLYGKKHKKKKNNIFRNAHLFSSRFSRKVNIHFMGLWDTVSSIGWAYSFRKFAYTKKLPNVFIVRHAVALDEKRVYYKPVPITKDIFINIIDSKDRIKQDLIEQWFVGVHSDIGGSYHDDESGLAMLPWIWILSEASKEGLLLDKDVFQAILRPPKKPKKWKRKSIIHESVKGLFWFLEWLPRYTKENHPLARLKIDFKDSRKIPDGVVFHKSVSHILNDIIENKKITLDLSKYYDKVEFKED